MPNPWVSSFSLSLTRALADQLGQKIRQLTPGPLTHANIANIEARGGIYVLWHHGERVYVGKATHSLRDRLGQHLIKLSGRRGLNVADVNFVCVYVDEDLDAAAPEKLLIKEYRRPGDIPWNTNGFGNKDPGRRRDHSLVEAKHFDAIYPINLDFVVHVEPKEWSARDLLKTFKGRLPYLLRYEKKTHNTVLTSTRVVPTNDQLSARQLLIEILVSLPQGWQATALPGYMILYPSFDNFTSAQCWWRGTGSPTVEVTVGPNNRGAGDVSIDDEPADDEHGEDDE